MKTLIEKYLSGKANEYEHHQLLSWMRDHDHLKVFQQTKNDWEQGAFLEEIPENSKESWKLLQGRLLKETQNQLQKSTRYLRIFQYAAIFIAVVFIASVGAKLIGVAPGTDIQYSIVKADAGQIANVVLPDHTEVWLNSGSYIKYNNEFASSNREIELVGEAYFNVTKNPELPLVVTGSPVHVKVLGTKFNISAYPEDNYFNVTLEEGKVELNSDLYRNFKKELKPNELAVFNKKTAKLSIKEVNVDFYTSWKDGMINIYNLPLEEVIVKLSKRYNQKFKIDEELKQIKYTYTIKNESLADILRLMETITPIDVIQSRDVISLKYNKQKEK